MSKRKAGPPFLQDVLEREQLCSGCPADPKLAWRGVIRFLEADSERAVLYALRNAVMSSGSRLSYNFNNLRYQGSKEPTIPQTIEFRQHAGTTDLVEMAC